MTLSTPANLKHKDTFFTKLFSEPQTALKLYNAISESCYPLDTPIEITTLQNVLFNGRHNDLSFILDGKLVVLIEHQSTINPNMPLRLLFYLARLYDEYVSKMNIYVSSQIKIPSPEFIVLYNGIDPYPDENILKLSDAFLTLPDGHIPSGGLELTVRVLNINKGHNQSIIQKSAELGGYVDIVDEIRKNCNSGMSLDDAISKAVKDCADKNVLTDFLEKHGGDVMSFLTAEWKLDEYLAVVEYEKAVDTATLMLQDSNEPEKVAKYTRLPLEKVYELQSQLKQDN